MHKQFNFKQNNHVFSVFKIKCPSFCLATSKTKFHLCAQMTAGN